MEAGSALKRSRRGQGWISKSSRVLRARAAERRRLGTTIYDDTCTCGSTRTLREAARWLSRALLCFAITVRPGAAEAEAAVAIAVLPIVVHSAESPEYLREGLADMLASRLEQVPRFQVIRVADNSKATTSLSMALQTARGQGADFVLFGSFTRFGQGASLDMQCAATAPTTSGKPLREIFVHSGSIGDVIPDLDELVGKVSRFAIADFEDSTEVSASPNSGDGGAKRRLVDDLRNRVEALERSVLRLSRELKGLKGKSEDE